MCYGREPPPRGAPRALLPDHLLFLPRVVVADAAATHRVVDQEPVHLDRSIRVHPLRFRVVLVHRRDLSIIDEHVGHEDRTPGLIEGVRGVVDDPGSPAPRRIDRATNGQLGACRIEHVLDGDHDRHGNRGS